VLRAYGSSLGPRVRGLGVLAIFFRVALVQFDGMDRASRRRQIRRLRNSTKTEKPIAK
jgi:hypothetical protein